MNSFRVCVDGQENDIFGRVYSPLSARELSFDGIEQLLVKMDRIFDEAGYPQSFQDKRSFDDTEGNHYQGRPQRCLDEEIILQAAGKTGTYDVLVDSRRNASWQGKVTRLPGGEVFVFLGEMELLKYLL